MDLRINGKNVWLCETDSNGGGQQSIEGGILWRR